MPKEKCKKIKIIKCYKCCCVKAKDGKFFCNNSNSKNYSQTIRLTPYTGCEDGYEDEN